MNDNKSPKGLYPDELTEFYQIEDSQNKTIVFVAIAFNPNDVIEEFNKYREVLS